MNYGKNVFVFSVFYRAYGNQMRTST